MIFEMVSPIQYRQVDGRLLSLLENVGSS